MKVTHVCASLSRRAAGIFAVNQALAEHLFSLGVNVEAIGMRDEQWLLDQKCWEPVKATTFPIIGSEAFGFSPRLLKYLLKSQSDLLHLHNLWMFPSVAVSIWHAKKRKPYIVTANGMLEPWALHNSAWKKVLAGRFYENRMLANASCLQANTQKELLDFRAYGLKCPVAIIPNGVSLPKANVECEMRNAECKPGDAGVFSFQDSVFRGETGVHGTRDPLPATRNAPLRLLFLGRLHPKKGLVQALKAWAEIQNPKSKIQNYPTWQFVIAGVGESGYERQLKQLCRELNLSVADIPAEKLAADPNLAAQGQHSIVFTGPAYHSLREDLMNLSSAFILPSLSEGLPMAVLHAWSHGLPVLMTSECNLPEGFAAGASLRISVEDKGKSEIGNRKSESSGNIEGGLQTLFEMSDADRVAMGERGRRLVEDRFTWPKVAAQMKEVYEWILGGGHPPDCVAF